MEKTMIELLQNRLNSGIVKFTYLKKDGSERTAEGTTNVETVAKYGATPKGTGAEGSPDVTRYYDTNSAGWRSFKNENLVSINN